MNPDLYLDSSFSTIYHSNYYTPAANARAEEEKKISRVNQRVIYENNLKSNISSREIYFLHNIEYERLKDIVWKMKRKKKHSATHLYNLGKAIILYNKSAALCTLKIYNHKEIVYISVYMRINIYLYIYVV